MSATVAQELLKGPAEVPFDIMRVAYGVLQVRDLDASLHFYEELLGLRLTLPRRRRRVPQGLGGAPAPLARAAQGGTSPRSSGSASACAPTATSTCSPTGTRSAAGDGPDGRRRPARHERPDAARVGSPRHAAGVLRRDGAAARPCCRTTTCTAARRSCASTTSTCTRRGSRRRSCTGSSSASAARSTSPPTPSPSASPARGCCASRRSTTSRSPRATGPRLHHLAMWVAEPNGILRLCDQLGGAHWTHAIERGPGRHGVSNAFFVYLRDPDGHRLELYTCDYYTGDPDHAPLRWSVNDPRCRSFWGTRAPDSWYDESSMLLGPDGRPVADRGGDGRRARPALGGAWPEQLPYTAFAIRATVPPMGENDVARLRDVPRPLRDRRRRRGLRRSRRPPRHDGQLLHVGVDAARRSSWPAWPGRRGRTTPWRGGRSRSASSAPSRRPSRAASPAGPPVDVHWLEGEVAPRVAGALASMECRPWRSYDGGRPHAVPRRGRRRSTIATGTRWATTRAASRPSPSRSLGYEHLI